MSFFSYDQQNIAEFSSLRGGSRSVISSFSKLLFRIAVVLLLSLWCWRRVLPLERKKRRVSRKVGSFLFRCLFLLFQTTLSPSWRWSASEEGEQTSHWKSPKEMSSNGKEFDWSVERANVLKMYMYSFWISPIPIHHLKKCIFLWSWANSGIKVENGSFGQPSLNFSPSQ